MLAYIASFIYGAASIVALTTFFVSAQVALPEWVRGRGLAIFLTVYFGALTLGSAVWVKSRRSRACPSRSTCAGVGTLIGVALTWGVEAPDERSAGSDAVDALARAFLRPSGRGR